MLVLLLCLCSHVHASDIVGDMQARIEQFVVLRGEFTQAKTLVGFRTALQSRGTFLVARDHGVVWDTQEPFPSMLVLGRDRIRSGGPDALEDVPLSGHAEQAMQELNAILMALLSGNGAVLSDRFYTTATPDGDLRWSMRMTPSDPRVMRAVRSIELEGGRFVDRVVLLDPAGNRTEITFSGQRTGPSELTEAEAKLFE